MLQAMQGLEMAREHVRMGRRAEGERLCRGILEGDPGNAEALDLVISIAYDAGKWVEAEGWMARALAAWPGEAKYQFGYANVFLRQRKWQRGLEEYEKGLALLPDSMPALVHYGICLQRIGRVEDAKKVWKRAIELSPDDVDAHFQLAWVQMLDGEWEEGLEHYEWRERFTALKRDLAAGAAKRWDGGDLAGKTILLYAEQGVGDCLQFIRYAPLVAELGGKVVVKCQDETVRLVRKISGIAEVATFSEVKRGRMIAFDVCCPMLSLPRMLRTRVETIPWNGAYLMPEEAEVKAWGERLKGVRGRKVGLVWAGNPGHPNDWERSISLGNMGALVKGAAARGVTFFSLQKGRGAPEAMLPPLGMRLVDVTGQLRDFSDTAALVANLDLVIGVDTAVVHLVGGMGKPVWTMVSAEPDWRWLREGRATGWYPSMRLFRQEKLCEWGPTIKEVGRALEVWVGNSE